MTLRLAISGFGRIGRLTLRALREMKRDDMKIVLINTPGSADIAAHLKLDFDHGKGKYNFLQKITYGLVLGVILPGMVLTGIAISPGMEPTFGWMVDLMGGRQSARSFHFIFAALLFGFFVVHVLLVILSGPIWQLRSMITGRDTR